MLQILLHRQKDSVLPSLNFADAAGVVDRLLGMDQMDLSEVEPYQPFELREEVGLCLTWKMDQLLQMGSGQTFRMLMIAAVRLYMQHHRINC